MPEIHVLDNITVDQIAAGEVIERPVSVVKELVENALDAGADAVTVEIAGGGIELIRVTDNGCGIPKEQVPVAFARHATSKIRNADDLFALSSLGFRGEALSSIASVAKVELVTRTADSEVGYRYIIEGGKEKSGETVAAPVGTSFYVRDLFFNTPVRRKFLKSAQTETSYVTTLMEQLMLSRPGISMTLIADGRTKLQVNGSYRMKDVIYTLYGRETAAMMRPLDYSENGLRIFGYVGLPTLCRGNRGLELTFINGRFVKSALMMRAVEQAYHGLTMQHKFPVAILHLETEPSLIDVNVHPTKMEVRFRAEKDVFDVIYHGIRETLFAKDLIPEIKDETAPEKPAKPERPAAAAPLSMQELRKNVEKPASDLIPAKAALSPADPCGAAENSPAPRIREDAGDYRVDADRQLLERMLADPGRLAKPLATAAFTEKAAEKNDTGFLPEKTAPVSCATAPESPAASERAETPAEETKAPQGAKKPLQMDLFEEKILEKSHENAFRLIGQVFDTYWLMEYEGWFLLADQHAVHEKILYERTMKSLKDKSITSQLLNPPVMLTLSAAQAEVLVRYAQSFANLGFEIDHLGGREYCISAVPDNLFNLSASELFLNMLDELAEDRTRVPASMVEAKVAMMSCKAAVKGNQRLSFAEAEALLKELLTLDNPYACPHGRPTMIRMSKTELEKKFKRIV